MKTPGSLKSNLFLTESPLQVLSANEARDRFQSEHNILVVRRSGVERERNNQHIQQACRFANWKPLCVAPISESPLREILFQFSLFFRLRRYSINELFIGDFRSPWMQNVRSTQRHKSCFLLDDGVVTIDVQKILLRSGKFRYRDSGGFGLRPLFRWLLDRIGVTEFSTNKPVHLFTAFDLHSDLHQMQKYLKNDYRTARKKSVLKTLIPGQCFHFGTKYSEAGFFSIETEIAFLNKVCSFYRNRNIEFIYIPHRDDCSTKISRISEDLKCRIMPLDSPAELFFLSERMIPQFASAAFSTALVNISCFFPEIEASFFELPMSEVHPEKRIFVEGVYTYYRNLGFEVLQIN
ncbi:MAG: hypothetical protein JJT96_20860 [Opitutales bacterium]|nr:hypothetical protein [Opitutales bacterium]